MEIRGMLGSRPVKLIVVRKEWIEVIDLISGEEITRKVIHRHIHLDGDLLDIGGMSIAIDRTNIPEAQGLVNLVSRLPRPPANPLIQQSRFCTQCGNVVDGAARFCSTCGNSLGEPMLQVPPPPSAHILSASSPSSRKFDDSPRQPTKVQPQGRNSTGMSATSGRYLFVVAIAVVIIIVAVIATRDGGGSTNASSGDVRSSAACATLSKYAYDGIPATFIDDGAQLLYSLSDQFRSMGRSDIANRIDNIVDLTYGGPTGQLNAKNELISAASSYC